MRFRLFLALAAVALLNACANPLAQAPTPAPQSSAPTSQASVPTTQPRAAARTAYTEAECKFEKPAGVTVACGYLTVPEDHSKPDGKTIRLHVAVFKSKSKSPAPDPIVYLEGGPGGHALEGVQYSFKSWFEPFLADRDFIIFDQRGTGYSEPALDCPELTELSLGTLDQNLSAEASTRLSTEATLKCHDRLVGQGVNLAAYTDVENAADLNDLRLALGFDTWNLYGISYGTELAETEMRDFPEGIRSVILDSTVPLQTRVDLDVPANADRAFRKLFDGCAADADCNKAFPNLKPTFYELVDQLNKKPVKQQATDPLSGKPYTVLLNGDVLMNALFQALYQTDYIPLLPKAIAAAHTGEDYSFLARLVLSNAVEQKFFSPGMYYSVKCNEEIPFVSREELAAATKAFPEQHNVFDQTSFVDICRQWGAKAADPRENEPLKSDIPTLALSGEYDPITPPQYNELVAKTLSRSYFHQFPGIGHGVSVSDQCPRDITMAFLQKPAADPDASCIAAMHGPSFDVPGKAVALKPFENKRFGIKGVAPEGWSEAAPGVYMRSSGGDIALLEWALPQPRDAALPALLKQFKLEKLPESSGTRTADKLTWSLYDITIQGQPADMALAQKDGTTYLVLLASSPSERKALHDQVFLPALDALTPTG